ncbi:MAG: beta-ketoacyl synthase, partial [Actinobacteria bacterium]|nr:beta-ketoacyl synthase [Actinomycetota bacterium]
GQAGFFSGNELAEALGVLWSPADGVGDLDPDARVDGPAVVCTKSTFSAADLEAFGEGRVSECFGLGYEWTHTHTRTPKIQAGDRLFIDEVTAFDIAGGLWGRGFMRCETTIEPDAWFFDGHFKNDPCMPGNFMVEACIQALSFYLTALGHTTQRDGWRFQPLANQPFDLKCRGEINPQTQHVAYEIYVEEVWDGPHPTVIADVVGFVDGKPAFHAHRLGVELVPGWPLTSMPELVATSTVDSVVVAVDGDGFEFGWKAMLSCAWGKPSEAFGSMYEVFDGTRRSPRLPGPPYHFISRVVSIDGEVGDCQAGMEIICEYDIPTDAWYFDQNGAEVMPFAVLLEAALQPCGWVASAVGSAVEVDDDLLFRNLDGTGTVLGELTRTSGVLTTKVKLTSVSRAGGMIIEGFEVECWLGDRQVYEMTTVFGFFPPEAFEDQVGLRIDTAHETQLDRGSVDLLDLTARPARFCDGTLRLAGPLLLMLDRAAVMPAGGEAGLGIVVGEKDVDIAEWFFKAHFFQDPVQPGSLGIEALLQLLQFFIIDSGVADAFESPRFEPISVGSPLTWKYRGQVTPKNRLITSVMEITEVGADEAGPFVVGKGSLWCDGLRIYEVENMAMRVVNGAPADAESLPTSESTIRVDASTHPHLVDHSIVANGSDPVAVIPVAYAVEWFARAAEDHSARFHQVMHVVELVDIRVLSGVSISDFANGGGTELKLSAHTTKVSADGVRVALRLVSSETGRPHYSCSALLGATGFKELQGVGGLPFGAAVELIADPYDGDTLFHGPKFRVLGAGVELAEPGARARVGGVIEHGWSAEPWQTDVAMFDGALQLALLSTNLVLGGPSLPTSIRSIRFLRGARAPTATVDLAAVSATRTSAKCDVSLTDDDGIVFAELLGIETHLLPKS